jgi:hypothetical protein
MNNFKEKFKLYFKKRTQRISIFGLSVDIDWFFILLCSFTLVIVGLVCAIFMYRDIVSGKVFIADTVEEFDATHEIKEKEIQKTIEYLKQR